MDVPAPRTSHATHQVADHMSKLAFLFPLGIDGKAIRTRNFEDADFNLITEVLRTLDLPSWATIPRTYAVLRMVNRVDDIDAFTALKLSDLSIPYSKDNLPQSLSLSTKAKFVHKQVFVLTSSMDLERGEFGGHKHISSSEDLQFERIADLGRGGGCTHVEKVLSNVGQKHYAVKYIRRAQYFQHDRKALKDFESELQNAKKVVHHHVVKIVGSFTEPLSVGIVMGTIGEQNLAQLLRGVVTSDTRSLLRTYFGCLASGLFAIHQADIKHKDIKPENVIIRKSVVYLTDFGLALDFSTIPENRSTTFGKPSVKHTPLYSAPEWWDYSQRDRRSDIWSLGAVYLEIATVLYKETLPKLFDFLGQHGSRNVLSYSRNMPAVWEWIEILRSKQGHEKDTVALDLTLATMKERIEERPTSYELWNLVERLSPPDVSFACRACVESFNPSEKESEELNSQPPISPETLSTVSASSRSIYVTKPSARINITRPSSLLTQKERLSLDRIVFGIETDNDENIYTTTVDTSTPLSTERLAKARAIEKGIIGSRSLNRISGDQPDVDKHPMEAVVYTPEASRSEASAFAPPKTTAEVEHEVTKALKSFAAVQRQTFESILANRARFGKEVKLKELKEFAVSFRNHEPISSDLIPIIAKDPAKQNEIQQKALQNVLHNAVQTPIPSDLIPIIAKDPTKHQKEIRQKALHTTAIHDQTYMNGNQTEMMTTKSVQEAAGPTQLVALLESTKHLAIPVENDAGRQSISQGPWTIREDAQLIRAAYVSQSGDWQWISAVVGSRTPGQCKKRWEKVMDESFEHAGGLKILIHVLEGKRNLGI